MLDPNWTTFAICLYIFSHYNTDWIANIEIGLDPSNSVIKRLWCRGLLLFVLCAEVYSITTIKSAGTCKKCQHGLYELRHEKIRFLLMRKQRRRSAVQCAVTAQLISAFVFATRIVQFLLYLHPKFQDSNILL